MFHLFWIEVILTLLLNSLFIWGLYAASQYSFDINGNITDKEILWKLKYYAEKLPLFIAKPLILCPICMSSVYGTILYLFNYNYSEYMYLPLYIICLAGLQYLIFRIIE